MSKIPIKGMNPALKKVAENITKKAQVDDAIKNVRRTMAKTAESSKPIKDVIDDTVGLSIKRKANGRRDIKSARDSANTFMRTENRLRVDVNEDIAKVIDNRNDLISNNRKRSQELKDKYNKKATNLEEAMRNAEINQKRSQIRNNTLDLSDRGSKVNERDFVKASPEEMLRRREKANQNKTQEKIKKDISVKNTSNWVYKAAAAGVGGGMVLSMANNKGQQTNNQLYGQGGY